MRSGIEKGREFYIISRAVDNAELCTVSEVCRDCFKVKLKNSRNYEADEAVELFSAESGSRLYFETIVKEVSGDILLIWFPLTSKYLQRREYYRISENKSIALSSENDSIGGKILDISAGGLKIITSRQLELLKIYKISIIINSGEINASFQPIRIEASKEGFISSGKFDDITSHDRIALIQYCFRKQLENTQRS